MCCACLLILLLPVSGLDDVLAAPEPDPSDDVPVAQVSESQFHVRQRQRSQGRRAATPRADLAQPGSLPFAPARDARLLALFLSPVRPDLLYVLMSFQR
jgi:hypothetical protein